MDSLSFDLKNKTLLDVGCGNGMVTNLIHNYSELKRADGTDPFADGEHTTSWQKLNHSKILYDLRNFITSKLKNELVFKKYKNICKQEDYSVEPKNIKLKLKNKNKIKIFSYGAHDLKKLNKKYDIIYCKAIEHISNWKKCVQGFSSVLKKNGLVFIKHRSFFSYLGPHRYGSTHIPWGHVQLSRHELMRYIELVEPHRAYQFKKFYKEDINFRHETVDDLIRYFNDNGFYNHSMINESARYQKDVVKLLKKIPHFYKNVKKNYPYLSNQELFSGIYTLVFCKI